MIVYKLKLTKCIIQINDASLWDQSGKTTKKINSSFSLCNGMNIYSFLVPSLSTQFLLSTYTKSPFALCWNIFLQNLQVMISWGLLDYCELGTGIMNNLLGKKFKLMTFTFGKQYVALLRYSFWLICHI